jgi:uncharacterized protein with FMN-binding domain
MANNNTRIIGIVVIVVIALTIGGLKLTAKKPTDDNSSAIPSTADTGSSNSASSESSTPGPYKDGTYSASGQYTSPGGNESIDVSLTIKDGKVADSTVSPHAATEESQEHQNDFKRGYASLIKGKDLSTLKLSKVSGSSLTSQGFNAAVEKIRNQAKV